MRQLKKEECDLIAYLLNDKPEFRDFINALPNLLVEEMSDGGMGSLKFLESSARNSIMKDEVAQISVRDSDGVFVSFTLNTNLNGEVYELDAFKGDFSPLKRFPLPPY